MQHPSAHNFTVTSAATTQLQEVCAHTAQFLRISVHGGGCAGFQYELQFDVKADHDDVVLYQDSIARVITDGVSLPFLQQCTLDFTRELVGDAFRIINPKAKSSCGCGVSFSL